MVIMLGLSELSKKVRLLDQLERYDQAFEAIVTAKNARWNPARDLIGLMSRGICLAG